ncbi:sigma-70 family RNA polymerase sigma factor [Paenibacillus lemnae]|uniref:Sigma-70 family RNA polymerase sigma factor n=1 Tax=Paenibacillus lemnae TaxID=1330551 RepID=A0A848M328_PAELE|nr:sigma-70 family RNA polymerase sigma factor [Paenibacillus lemnae]NMO94253.1 sigma-70 family RNA polymerase sigma factor [Paenibacillus lemnae]
MKEVNVQALLTRMADGDDRAFEELYMETRHDVYRMVAFLIPDSHDAVEVANEVYVQLWKSFRTYDGNRPFHFWLHGIVVRLVNNHRRSLWRHFRRHDMLKQTLRTSDPQHHEPMNDVETRDEMMYQVMKLSKKLRTVVVLRCYQDYSLEEIADLLNIPVGTVKSRYHAAITKLRTTWNHISDEKVESSHEYRITHS